MESMSTHHETAEFGMHPQLQENWRIARSVLESLEKNGGNISELGMSEPSPIIAAFFAAKLKKQDELDEMGYIPRFVYLGDGVDRYEIPAPFVMTLGSATSARAATIKVVYTGVNVAGYGDLNTAEFTIDQIHDSLDDAEQRIKDISRARQTMRVVIAEHDRANGEARVRASYGPSF